MARSRTAFLSGTITDNPLSNVATTINSAGLASLPAIASPDIAVLVLDPTGSAGAPEVVYVTAHTAAATSATISRAAEGSTARQHASGIAWVHGPTTYDFREAQGSNIASATTLTLPTDDSQKMFLITGTTQIEDISDRPAGSRLYLYFNSDYVPIKFTAGQIGWSIRSGLSQDLLAMSDEVLEFISLGTSWLLVSRTSGPVLGWQVVGRQGSTEATSTATSPADMVTISSLSIPTSYWVRVTGQMRKSAGNASACSIGIKINATVVIEAAADIISGTTSEAQSGAFEIIISPRSANYLKGITGVYNWNGATDGFVGNVPRLATGITNDLPNATITSIVIRGDTASASNTVGVNNVVVEIRP